MQAASWCRANAMLLISLLLAAVTAFFVPPDAQYLGYYDLKTLACLFSVLAVVAALRDLNIFAALSQRLVRTFGSVRSVAAMLIIITMLGSMLLTNDTALLTFLPLSWFVMHSTGQDKHIPLLFVLQNCAANLCGMLTPFGNPQNLYLFSYYNIPTSEFLSIMLPPFVMSTVLILLCCFAFPRTRLSVPDAAVSVNGRRAAVYGLLATFAAFFTFSGNLSRMEAVHALFARLLSHGAMLVSALTSQVISNVPAAILLSRFTDDYRGLLVGVNIGGAGTLVASLASLITFREYTRHAPGNSGRFLALFSAVSFAFLAVLLVAN